jgi:hypothetical protein
VRYRTIFHLSIDQRERSLTMNFQNEQQAIDLLKQHGVEVSSDFDIVYPRKKEFVDDVHNAIEYLLDEWDFGIKYI